ncbi:3-oxo-Delta(4,5)-steroid 5-beta-reductase [Linum perenne]
MVAEHHIWAATEERVQSTGGRAWREIWSVIVEKIGVAVPVEGLNEGFRFAATMRGLGGVWDEIVAEEGLVETEMRELAIWEFLDVLFRFPIKLIGSREKSDRLGFTARRETAELASYWID